MKLKAIENSQAGEAFGNVIDRMALQTCNLTIEQNVPQLSQITVDGSKNCKSSTHRTRRLANTLSSCDSDEQAAGSSPQLGGNNDEQGTYTDG